MLVVLAIVVIGVLGVAGAWRFRHRLRPVYHVARTVLASASMENSGSFTNVIFVHHSTGGNLIAQGQVRERLTEAGYDFWDHDYNYPGLTLPDGTLVGYSYNIPDDNTDPDGLAALFEQKVYRLPVNALSALLQHQVIIFKSCFPVSDIRSEEQLETYQQYYLSIRDVIAQHPDRLFIAMTPPPLVPESTTPENAARAREFADWLVSDEYRAGVPNLAVFDFFDALAEDDPASPEVNMLRAEYRPEAVGDSHPNELANQEVGPQFADFIIAAVEVLSRVE